VKRAGVERVPPGDTWVGGTCFGKGNPAGGGGVWFFCLVCVEGEGIGWVGSDGIGSFVEYWGKERVIPKFREELDT
jgi:hypothetical protein